ncbi:hypothetical protein FQN52_008621 [Onygenales sp. PD_12]|nr:hypothetical protein FQN52_008621 [Onygenales sp. PD_12]
MAATSSHRQSMHAQQHSSLSNQTPINGIEKNVPFTGDRRYASRRTASLSYPNQSPVLPEAPEVPRGPPASYRNSFGAVPSRRYAPGARSFSARAKELPAERALDTLEQLDPPQDSTSWVESQRQLNDGINASGKMSPQIVLQNVTIRKPKNPRRSLAPPPDPVQPPQSNSSLSPTSHWSVSQTSRKEGQSRRDWAPEKSPLQKLEVTLKDISKEEKRARVEEAEMLLREAKAGRRSRQLSREIIPTSKPAEPNRPKSSIVDPSTLEEAGLVRSLSSKQRDRLQQSAVIESTKADARRFSKEGRGGFDYQEQPLTESNKPVLQEPILDGPIRILDDMGQRRASVPSGKAAQPMERSINETARLQKVQNTYNRIDDNDMHGPVREPSGPRPATDIPPAPEPMQRSNSRKLQKPFPRDLNTQLLADSRDRKRVLPPAVSSASVMQDVRPSTSRNSSATSKKALAEIPDNNSPVIVGLGLTNTTPPQGPIEKLPLEKSNQTKPKQHSVSFAMPPLTPPPLEEWKKAVVGRLQVGDFDLRDDQPKRAWWEGGGSGRRRTVDGASIEQQAASRPRGKANVPFQPPLYLECGPLLRYTGMKRETIEGLNGPVEHETWRGSVMIVTKDSASTYTKPPTLRFFSQPMDLLPPPPTEIGGESGELAPEYVDPIAGLTKLGRNGKLLYVKPVDHLEEGKDHSFIDNDDGLFEESPSPVDYTASGQVSKPPSMRVKEKDGESVGKYKEVKGIRLYADSARDVTFWRFNIEIELTDRQQRIAYRINQGSAIGFWVPAQGQSMNIMFHSGNGFSETVDRDKFSGPDPLWRDVLNTHQTRPFHVMIGGGDQIYNDAALFDTDHFRNWMGLKVPYEERHHPFNVDIKSELEEFFLHQYLKWFSHGLFSMANSQIPMVNMWNDHDILPGYGSYPHPLMRTPVMSGLGNLAFKYYMLFQHQSVPEETDADEPSWLLGAAPGPYINQKSRSVFMDMGKRVAFLGVDCQTERTRDDVLMDDSSDLIFNRCHDAIVKGETKHLIVLLSVPIAYPRLVWLENVLNSRMISPVKVLSRARLFGGMSDKFGVDMETIESQWTSKTHKLERGWLMEDLQELAAEKSVRITILSGDAQLAAIGQFYSNPKLQIAKDKDYRYMPNVISSAIANAPASEMMADALNKRNKVHFLDNKTVEDMRAIFTHDVDGKPRNNKRLLPRRNWCTIREYDPGTTPSHTPTEEEPPTPEFPRGKLRRSLSLSRGDGRGTSLLRRLSLRGGPPPSRSLSMGGGVGKRGMSHDGLPTSPVARDSYFPPQNRPVTATNQQQQQPDDSLLPRPGNFIRRRTDLSAKDIKREAKEGLVLQNFINLEGGLDITLNCETNPRDPAGITTAYRVLVPALWFEGTFERSEPTEKKRWWVIGRKKRGGSEEGEEEEVGQQRDVDDDGGEGEHYDERYDEHNGEHDHGHYEREQYDGEEYDSDNENEYDTPPRPPAHGQGQAPVAQGYSGVDAYRPRKKWLGII